jgi:DNA gyrase subunit A
MKDDPEEVVVDEDGNVVEVEAIERVKPVLEVLEDDGVVEDDDDEDEFRQ